MSDFSQIAENLTNEHREETNDEQKMITVPDQKPATSEKDSDYDDIDDDEDEADVSILTASVNKATLEKPAHGDELDIDIQPRRSHQRHEADERSEGDDEEDNQSVPTIEATANADNSKKSEKTKEAMDDDNNTRSPAYIPRRGKFYEHDDRTLAELDCLKPQVTRIDHRFYTGLDGKWQHDLYFQDESKSNLHRSFPKANRERVQHAPSPRERPLVSDRVSQPPRGLTNFPQQQYRNEYRPQATQKPTPNSHNDRIRRPDLKEHDRSSTSYHRADFSSKVTIAREGQRAPREQRQDRDLLPVDERVFHRRRSVPTGYAQQANSNNRTPTQPIHRHDQKPFAMPSNGPGRFADRHQAWPNPSYDRDARRRSSPEHKSKLPPRLQTKNTSWNVTPKQYYEESPSLNLSPNVSANEPPKRYSNMRNHMPNPLSRHAPPAQMQRYQEPRVGKVEQNDWPQVPAAPPGYLPRQLITPQMFYQQQSSRQSQMASTSASMSQQLQERQ